MPTHLHCSASSCSPINSKHIKMFPQYLSSPIPICTCCALPFFIAISLVFPCPPQNVQHLHRHFLLHFLAPLRMSSTSIAIFSFISLPPSECPAPPLPEQVTTSTPETQLPHTPTWQPAHTTRCVFTFMCACVCVSVPVCFFECTYFRYCEQRQCARTSHRLKNVQHTLLVHP